MAKIQSRHINNLQYNVYIKYRPGGNSYDGIEGWYCTCKDGSRTIGCCSHITCIIYYFGYGKYEVSLKKPANHLNNIFPTQRLEFLSHLEDIVSNVIQNTEDIEENYEIEYDERFDNNNTLEDFLYEDNDELLCENDDIFQDSDEIDDKEDLEYDFDITWNKKDPYDFLNEITEETRNLIFENVRKNGHSVDIL